MTLRVIAILLAALQPLMGVWFGTAGAESKGEVVTRAIAAEAACGCCGDGRPCCCGLDEEPVPDRPVPLGTREVPVCPCVPRTTNTPTVLPTTVATLNAQATAKRSRAASAEPMRFGVAQRHQTTMRPRVAGSAAAHRWAFPDRPMLCRWVV